MKTKCCTVLFFLTAVMSAPAYAQESAPAASALPAETAVPAAAPAAPAVAPAASDAAPAAPAVAPAASDAAPAAPAVAPAVNEVSARMIEFFDGLIKIADNTADCEEISVALQRYYTDHQAWIDSLDYAVEQVDEATMSALQQKARAFGKKLSVCYADKAIPTFLNRYSDIDEEAE